MKPLTTLQSFVDEVVAFRGRFWISGWAYDRVLRRLDLAIEYRGEPVAGCEVEYPLRSPDVAGQLGGGASACRFRASGPLPRGAHADELELVVRRGPFTARRDNLYLDSISTDPYHLLEHRFFVEAGHRILEVGSRSRSGTSRREKVGVRDYLGIDIVEGPNVDVVADVHDLSHLASTNEPFDAVFAVSVFEHVLMPWKAAVEINAVLKPGGLVFVGTHQSFPLHEVPWDYFRFSDTSWRAIFNASTGFEIVATAMGEKAAIVPLTQHPISREVMHSDAWMAVGVLARKTGEATVDWDVDASGLVSDLYSY